MICLSLKVVTVLCLGYVVLEGYTEIGLFTELVSGYLGMGEDSNEAYSSREGTSHVTDCNNKPTLSTSYSYYLLSRVLSYIRNAVSPGYVLIFVGSSILGLFILIIVHYTSTYSIRKAELITAVKCLMSQQEEEEGQMKDAGKQIEILSRDLHRNLKAMEERLKLRELHQKNEMASQLQLMHELFQALRFLMLKKQQEIVKADERAYHKGIEEFKSLIGSTKADLEEKISRLQLKISKMSRRIVTAEDGDDTTPVKISRCQDVTETLF